MLAVELCSRIMAAALSCRCAAPTDVLVLPLSLSLQS